MDEYEHLEAGTIPMLSKTLNQKIRWVNQPHFVFFDELTRLYKKLKEILERVTYTQQLEENELYNIESMAILGDTGSGKSTFCDYFLKQHPRIRGEIRDILPVTHVELQNEVLGLTGFYSSLIAPYGSPYSNPENFASTKYLKLERWFKIVKDHIIAAQTKIIFVDEFQHLISSFRNFNMTNQAFIDQLKMIMHQCKVAIIPVGYMSVKKFLQLDPQFVNRCPVRSFSKFKNWYFPEMDYQLDYDEINGLVKKRNPDANSATIRMLIDEEIHKNTPFKSICM
jgi:hypothetical protein